MRIIEIRALINGAHRNQAGNFHAVPNGWAEIPDDMEIPETYPFVDLVVQGNQVISMTAGAVPEPGPEPEPEPTETEQLRADVEFLAIMTGVTL